MKATLTLKASFDLEDIEVEYLIEHVKETLEKLIELGGVDTVELSIPAVKLGAKELL